MNEQCIVKVGTSGEDAVGQYAQHAGYNFHGPMTLEAAQEFVSRLNEEWVRVAQEDPEAFVYGVPSAQIIRLIDSSRDDRAASNWYLRSDDVLREVVE